MRPIYCLFFTSLLSLAPLYAQNTINGVVSDDGGLPLAGVNILEKGTTNGTTTDFDGNYSISVSNGAVLVFSYIGFNTMELNTVESPP